jgi:hypothetical protein
LLILRHNLFFISVHIGVHRSHILSFRHQKLLTTVAF